ncbi:hypothetical protein Tco_1320205 [Tanacetum coccineum]
MKDGVFCAQLKSTRNREVKEKHQRNGHKSRRNDKIDAAISIVASYTSMSQSDLAHVCKRRLESRGTQVQLYGRVAGRSRALHQRVIRSERSGRTTEMHGLHPSSLEAFYSQQKHKLASVTVHFHRFTTTQALILG